MCGGVHYGEVERLVSVERWSCSRGASCVVEHTLFSLTVCVCKYVRMCVCHPLPATLL